MVILSNNSVNLFYCHLMSYLFLEIPQIMFVISVSQPNYIKKVSLFPRQLPGFFFYNRRSISSQVTFTSFATLKIAYRTRKVPVW